MGLSRSSLATRLRGELPLWLLIGVVVRIALAPWFGHWFDMRTWMVVGAAVAHGRSPYEVYNVADYFLNVHAHLFGQLYGIGYPPFWGIVIGGLYQVSYNLVHNLYVYALALKLPIIIGDVAFAFLIRKVVTELKDASAGNLAASVWFLNPFVILAGVVWGMFDVLPLFFMTYSIYLLYKRNLFWSALSLAAANSIKPIGVVLIPTLCAYLWLSRSPRESGKFALLTFGALAAMTYGVIVALGWPISNFTASQVGQVSGVLGGASLFIGWIAYNFTLYGTDTFYIHQLLGVLWVPAVAAVSIIYLYRGKAKGFQSLLFWCTLTVAVSYAARTFVNETQMMIPLALLLVLLVLLPGSSIKQFNTLSWIMTAFLVIHAPITQFAWIGLPSSVAWTVAVTTSPLWGSLRWIGSAALVYLFSFLLFEYLWKNWKTLGLEQSIQLPTA